MDENGEPPPELSLAWQCQRWSGMPDAGGVMDQDAQLLYRMSALLNVTDALSRLRNMHGAQIHSLTDQERNILQFLVDLGLIFHA